MLSKSLCLLEMCVSKVGADRLFSALIALTVGKGNHWGCGGEKRWAGFDNHRKYNIGLTDNCLSRGF